jgi:hypothetical protein
MNDEVLAAYRSILLTLAGKTVLMIDYTKGDFLMVVDDFVFSDPVERRHFAVLEVCNSKVKIRNLGQLLYQIPKAKNFVGFMKDYSHGMPK